MPMYGTVAEADTYHADRGNAEWGAGDPADKTAALVRASQYLDAVYTWPGQVADTAQPLEWPRTGVTYRGAALDSAEVPLAVEQAAYEAASRELTQSGYLNPDFTLGGQIKSEAKAVGPLSKRIEYVTASGAISSRPKMPMIDGLLRGLIGNGAGAANFAIVRK